MNYRKWVITSIEYNSLITEIYEKKNKQQNLGTCQGEKNKINDMKNKTL